MLGNRRTDTRPELRLRSALHRSGLRFRKDFPIRLGTGRLIRADIVFTRKKVVVFVDGCFWHQCPEHGTRPRSNIDYWLPKFKRTTERDAAATKSLAELGWRVVRIWEHEDLDTAIGKVQAELALTTPV